MKTGEPLTTDTVWNVLVDLKKRRPTPATPHFLSAFIGKATEPLNIETTPFTPAEKPATSDVMSHDVIVDTNVLDYYSHTNQANYLKFVVDAVSSLTFSGKLKLSRNDFAEEKVKRMQMVFKNEAVPGQTLRVFCWKGNDSQTLNFQLENCKKNIVVFQCCLELY